ncbi:Alcohol dehydrogenase, zinc-binding protein [Rubrobacter xylanophilus DSM 9941]|uniref:Alcohol dehydrogenase, zinc-binding protein n=1 Tax=Rubrobacter xylanophilus (strain DSM 9941 / JCM 11954 / NBRC 16129 / PRD-1) TaxID=266117 RepID=Q1AZE6_RUBXD|nr:NAD(P)-dependent alcohol dehydrogenase [Rubrobacter xylanophilus]ABG03232.1 Alcohol dehydrogenase, zinc-binding protein [Rubrobacter xylanophilus DSM 9941]
MRAYELRGHGLENLALAERPEPRPGPGQLLVRMRAASLNYRDLLVARGRYGRGGVRLPLVPLSDGAGEVVETGPGATRFGAGDRVAGAFFQRWVDGPLDEEKAASALGGAVDGVLAERVVLEEAGAVRVPDHLSFEEAAALPCAGVTAWVGLFALGRLRPGETVLAMGTGGVSIFALQFAKMAGARVILTSSSDEKLERGRELGADETINYRETPDWDLRARELTGGRGVDHILEVGGAGTLPRSLRAVRDGGHLTLVGLLSGERADLEEAAKNERGVRVDSVYVGSLRHFEDMLRDIERARLRPVIDRVFAFEEARQAYEHLQSGRHFGKVVIRV